MNVPEEGKIYEIQKFVGVFSKKCAFMPKEGHSMVEFTSYTTVVERTGLDVEFDFSDAERQRATVSATRVGVVMVSAVKMTGNDQGHGWLGDQRTLCNEERPPP
jgi:hypothetical protein